METILEKMLLEEAETVFELVNNHDIVPTLQNKNKILEKIHKLDLNFYIKLKIKPVSFSYGDKYFAHINGKEFICVPKRADPKLILSITDDITFNKMIAADFKTMKKKLSGYFDIE